MGETVESGSGTAAVMTRFHPGDRFLSSPLVNSLDVDTRDCRLSLAAKVSGWHFFGNHLGNHTHSGIGRARLPGHKVTIP